MPPSSRRARGTRYRRLFAPLVGVLVALAWALSTSHAYAQPACKYDSASSTIECMPIVSSPWKYDPEGYYGDDSSTYDSYGEALDAALANIPAYWGSAFCVFDHEEYEPSWTVLARDADISKLERRTGAISGWLTLIQGGGCYYTQGQAVDVARTRTNACPAGWFQTYDGLGSLMCFREAQATPPPSCDRPCASGGPSSGGVDGRSSGWTGNPLFVHTGDKFLAQLDWSSGGHKPLALSRHYLSVSFPRLVHTPHRHFGLGDYWRTSFDRRIQTFVGPGITTKVAYRPDGSTRYFYRNGTAWQKRAEQSDALADVLDGGGAVVGWKLTLADDTREFYDLQGRVTAIVDASGWTQTVSYDTDDRVASVVDSLGRSLTFSYDGDGGLASVATPDGTIRYGLDGRTYLTSVTYTDGSQRQYRYLEPDYSDPAGPPGLLTGIVDENGARFATYRYDGAGRGWSTEHGEGANRYTIAIGATTTVTDPLGTTRTVGKSVVNGFIRSTGLSLPCPSCGPDENVGSATHDANGNVASRTFFTGKKTCYAYDLARNLETARVEGLTSAEDCASSLANPPVRPDVRKTTTAWHAKWRRPASIVEPAPGGTRTTTFSYDASGNLTQKKITAPKNDGTATTIARTWKWTYGSYGRVLTATDPNSKVTTTTYHPDDDPDLGRRGQVATVINPLGHVTQYPTYDAAGRLASMIDPNGVLTTLGYDARGRLVTRVVGGEETIYTYDLAGQLTEVELPDGATLGYVHDAAHRLTEVHDGLGNQVVYTLDGMGNRVAESTYDPSGVLSRTRSRVYDGLNRFVQEVGAADQTTMHGYDGSGNRLASTDPLGHTTTSTYDALNRLLTVTDPGNGVTRYAYDAAGNLASVTDARNLVTTYGFDGLGNAVTQVSPDTGTTTRAFDAAGNVKTSTDARGAKATTTYDAAGRVTRVIYSRTGFTSETHTFQWDGGTTGAPNAKGRLTQVTDPSGTTKWSYTPQGRVASRQQVSGSVTLTVGYAWTNARLTGITTPSGQQVGYAYTDGKVSAVTLNGSPLVSSVGYEPFGPVSAWQWGNGHKTWRDHDLDGRIETWEYRNGTSLLRRDLAFDAASRVTGAFDPTSQSNSHTYGYDVLDRLTTALSGATAPTTREYAYDAIGNRLNETADGLLTNYGYGPDSHRLLNLTGSTTRNYTYDGAGNPVEIDGRTYTYSLANRLVKVVQGATTIASYKVNALGQRMAKTVGSVTTRYVYDEQGKLVGEYASNGALIQETVWLGELPIATLRPTGTGKPTPVATYYVHADHLGSPRAVTRPSDDAIVWRWDNADPFGDNPADENPSGQGTFRYDLRFPGQQYDAETGTHYNYHRDYDPGTGRYLQSDPIELQGDGTLYQYVSSGPIASTDSFGLLRFSRSPRHPDKDWPFVGCGPNGNWKEFAVPDWPFNFGRCCTKHDRCYSDCHGLPTKASCDDGFCSCLNAQCGVKFARAQMFCIHLLAPIYCRAVRDHPDAQHQFEQSRRSCGRACAPRAR